MMQSALHADISADNSWRNGQITKKSVGSKSFWTKKKRNKKASAKMRSHRPGFS